MLHTTPVKTITIQYWGWDYSKAFSHLSQMKQNSKLEKNIQLKMSWHQNSNNTIKEKGLGL